MSHSIQLPDDLYEQIALRARQQGQTPDELLIAWLREHTHQEQPSRQDSPDQDLPDYDPAHDPIARFIGAFAFGVGDLATNHDRYLAEEATDTHDDEE